jgi:hypothetical protein
MSTRTLLPFALSLALPIFLSGPTTTARAATSSLPAAPSWTVTRVGPQQFGASASTAGDVDGDGYSDVIVGEPGYDGGQTDEGRILVYLGGPSGPLAVPDWTFEPQSTGARFGASLAATGDVNADGYDDVAVGAPGYSNPEPEEGALFVFFGGPRTPQNPAGLHGPGWLFEGGTSSARMGSVVAGIGDWNGSGIPDVATTSGSKLLIYRGHSNPSQDRIPLWSTYSADLHLLGIKAVAPAGDVNADGRDDFLIATRDEFGSSRVILFYYDPRDDPDLWHNPHWTLEGNGIVEGFGDAVSGVGDVNGDGYADLAIGIPRYDPCAPCQHEGRARLYLGREGTDGPVLQWDFVGGILSHFGAALGPAGDVNGDGFADFVIAEPYGDNDGDPAREGGLLVWLGRPGAPSYSASWFFDLQLESPGSPSYETTMAATTAGDVNGDGFGDLLAASSWQLASTGEQRGAVWSFFGAASPPDRETSPARTIAGQRAASGDVNGDGFADLVIGKPSTDSSRGRVELYLGDGTGLQTTPAWSRDGAQTGQGFGGAVAIVGDVDGDALDDLVVGSPWFDPIGAGGVPIVDAGLVQLFLGATSGALVTTTWSFVGSASEMLGQTVASAGDVDGDGLTDAAVGAPQASRGESLEGRVLVFLGSRTSGLSPSPVWVAEGNAANVRLGFAIAAGDVNGDGASDLAAAAQSGVGRVWYGASPGGLAAPGTPSWATSPVGAGAWAVASGDVNGDGFSDLLFGIGGPGAVGAVLVKLGSPSGLRPEPADGAFTLAGHGQTFLPPDGFGMAITTSDVDADGDDDVLVGAPYVQICEPTCATPRPGGVAQLFEGAPSGTPTYAWSTYPTLSSVPGLGLVLASGDWNGDGFGDLAAGTASVVSIAMGNGEIAGGLVRRPRQAQNEPVVIGLFGLPIARFGDTRHLSALFQLVPWLPGGRTRMRLELELEHAGVSFDSGGLLRAAWRDSADGSLFGPPLANLVVPELDVFAPYHWRARVATPSPLFPHSPWFQIGAHPLGGAHFREGVSRILQNDHDFDGMVDPFDNCPFAANPGQEDGGGIGAGSAPDGIGDACQCGDVSGDGRVTLSDSLLLTRSLLEPPTATLARPELCDAGASAGCSLADAVILRRALLAPPTATILAQCPPAQP